MNVFSTNLTLKDNKIKYPFFYTDFYSFYFFDGYNIIPEKHINSNNLFKSNGPFLKKYFKKISEHLTINYENIYKIVDFSKKNPDIFNPTEVDLCMQMGTIMFLKTMDDYINNLYLRFIDDNNHTIEFAINFEYLQFINIIPFIGTLSNKKYPFNNSNLLKSYVLSISRNHTEPNKQLYISKLLLFFILCEANAKKQDDTNFSNSSLIVYNSLLEFYNNIYKDLKENSINLSVLEIIKNYHKELTVDKYNIDMKFFINRFVIDPLKNYELGKIKSDDLDSYFNPINIVKRIYSIQKIIDELKKENEILK